MTASYADRFHSVKTETFQNTVRNACTNRHDEWGDTILGRLNDPRCSCRKIGLPCTVACKHCCEAVCGNMKTQQFDIHSEDGEDIPFEEDDN